MAEVKIYLNLDKQLDGITPDTDIALTFAEAKFNSLVSRGGTLSNRFQLAKTANNKRQLGLLDDPNSDDSRPYQLYDCRIEVDGQPTFTGLAVIEESQDYFNLRVFSGITDFFELLGDKTLQDLDLSTYDHEWTAANVKGAQQNNNTQGYVYPNINYGRWTRQTLAARPHTDFFPAVYFKTLLETAATEAGYTLQNYNEDWAIPFCKQFFDNEISNYGTATSLVNKTLEVDGINPENRYAFFPSVTNNNLGFFEQITGGASDYTQVAINRGAIILRVTLTYSAALSNAGTVRLGVYNFEPTPADPLESILLDPGDTGTVTFDVNYSNQTANTNTFIVNIAGPGGDQVTIEAGSKIEILHVKSSIFDGDTISIAAILPNIKIKDLFLFEAVRQNALLITDPIAKTLKFIGLNSIQSEKVRALDWSAKEDVQTKPKYEFRLREYAQNNYLNWKDGVEQDPAYAANNDLGQGNFKVNDRALKLDRDWYTAPFAASGNNTGFFNEPPILFIPRYSDTTLDYRDPDINPQPRAVKMEVNSNLIVQILGQVAAANNGNPVFKGFDFSVSNNYAGLAAMFDKMKLVEVYVKLTALDIQKLDITKPVYLLGAYWFIREVSQFNVTSANSTKLKLIRL